MGVQYKSAAHNDIGAPRSPLSKPTRSPRREMNGRKEEEAEIPLIVENEPPDDKPCGMTKAKRPFAERFLPLPYVLDLRSLALFRILFGLCQLGDIYGRLCSGKYDLAWYTSDPPERSYYYPDMAVQQFNGPLGQLPLFHRNSINAEIAFFVAYGILLTMLTVGFQCQNYWLLPTVWLFTNGLLCKGDAGSWGSDQLAQQLLVWMVFLPLSEEWSIDAWIRRRRNIPSRYQNHQVKSIACLGLALLINMMYIGCTLERTIHAFTWETLHESDWLWPDFPLVWYASNGSGTYNTWFTKIVRETAILNQFMTFSGFMIELLMPPLCFLLNQRYSHLFAINLVALHLGIGLIIAIPHFAALAALIHVIWIPTHVWDSLLKNKSNRDDGEVVQQLASIEDTYKKTDDDENGGVTHKVPGQAFIKRAVSSCVRTVSFLLQCLFLFLLIATFCHAHGWWRDETQGVTEMAWKYLLINNEWGMWSPGAERISPYTVMLGWRRRGADEDDQLINLFEFLKSGEEVEWEGFSEQFLADSTYLYPSTRWEKALGDDWATYLQDDEYSIADNLMTAWCHFINEDMAKLGRPRVDAIEIQLHLRAIGSPESGKRYTPVETAKEGSLVTLCFPEEEEDDGDHDEEGMEYQDEEQVVGGSDEF